MRDSCVVVRESLKAFAFQRGKPPHGHRWREYLTRLRPSSAAGIARGIREVLLTLKRSSRLAPALRECYRWHDSCVGMATVMPASPKRWCQIVLGIRAVVFGAESDHVVTFRSADYGRVIDGTAKSSACWTSCACKPYELMSAVTGEQANFQIALDLSKGNCRNRAAAIRTAQRRRYLGRRKSILTASTEGNHRTYAIASRPWMGAERFSYQRRTPPSAILGSIVAVCTKCMGYYVSVRCSTGAGIANRLRDWFIIPPALASILVGTYEGF